MKPLYDALLEYSERVASAFHMPGHKLGRAFGADGAFMSPARIDVTELDATDDLHCPEGPLLTAQTLAASAFGAGRTWFLVNGSSCGIFAMIAANCKPGQKLLIARDFHYSAYNAMRFARVAPVYAPAPDYNTNDDSVFTEQVYRALSRHPDAAALYLTRPGYYGGACDIAGISRLAHGAGIPLLVDEAHGAHLAFSRRLPICALEGGADFCVQSAHKTLPAFTQCAYAHVSTETVSRDAAAAERFGEALRSFQTSSPSFILTASLDYAREYMMERGERELDRILNDCENFYARMADAGYGIPGDIYKNASHAGVPGGIYKNASHAGVPGDIYKNASRAGVPQISGAGAAPPRRYGRDMTRLTLDTTPLGLSGAETDRLLWERYNIKIEMSDPRNIVMISTVADSDEDFEKLAAALEGIAAGRKFSMPAEAKNMSADIQFDSSEPHLAPDFFTDLHTLKRFAPLEQSAGLCAADFVTPYPPGVPVLCPGERITREAVDKTLLYIAAGARVKGVHAISAQKPDKSKVSAGVCQTDDADAWEILTFVPDSNSGLPANIHYKGAVE